MRIEQLQQLLKIVEMGSMNRAAEDMYMARSSLSTSMKNLEQELGEAIFCRNTKGVTLTPFGRDVYDQARTICGRIDFLKDSCGDKQEPVNLSVASMYCSLANDAFVELYSRYKGKEFTGSIEECTINEAIRMVAGGFCEIGIVTLFSDSENIALHRIEEAGLSFTKLADRRLCAIIGPKNPLYHQKREQTALFDLREYPYVVNYASPSDFTLEKLLDGRRRKRAEIQVSDLGCALRLIESTDAVMVDTYDKETYETFYAPNQLRFIPLADAPLACKLGWIRSREKSVSSVAAEFIAIMEEKIEKSNL